MEAAVSALAESHHHLQTENAKLRRRLDEAIRRTRSLDSELLAANQRRQDTGKRIDELIAHLDQLDSQLDEQQAEQQAEQLDEPSLNSTDQLDRARSGAHPEE